MHAESERWIQEFRALATSLGGEGLWIEKVLLQTLRAVTTDAALERDDALGGLLRAIRDLEIDAGALTKLSGELEDLRQKLPAELLHGEGGYDPTDPENLKQALEDVKELLLAQLLATSAEL